MKASSGAKARTALGTTGAYNLAAARSAHAGTEAVVTFALDNAGLKSSFHRIALGYRADAGKGPESY